MKLIREILYEKFTQESDPIEGMGIGVMHQIKHWVETETKHKPTDKNLLWICAERGKVDFVKYLLEKGYDVHAKNDYALQSASENGHVEVVKLLIDAGADVHAVNDYALRYASANGHTEVVKLLIDAGVNVHAGNDAALRHASENGHVEIVKLLLDACTFAPAVNNDALRWASANGHTEIVKLLLDAGADVHAINDWALRWASANGHTEVVKLLLDAGADVHADDDYALRVASSNGHTEVVKLLLDAGADVHAYDYRALQNASRNGHAEVVKLLRDYIAKEKKSNKIVKESINEKFTQDSDPIENMGIGMMHQIKRWVETETKYRLLDKNLLWICAERGKVDFVKYLLDKGYDVHAINDWALQSACKNGHVEVVKLLLDAGADVHAENDYALRWASYNGRTEVIKLLLDAGADVHAAYDYALRNASANGHTEVVKLLLDACTFAPAVNNDALGWASANRHTEVVKLLKDHIAKENKVVKESINEKFTQESDPIEDMGIGVMHQIKHWVETETEYKPIDKDLLWICAERGKVDFVKYLLEKSYDVHAGNDYALRYASRNGHAEIVKLLLDAGADVHANNDAALRFASEYGRTKVVKLLLDAGADVHANNDYALRWASANGHAEIVKLLLDAGANVHAENDYALRRASSYGHTEVVKLLRDHIAKENKSNKIVKESLNEKFTQDSDPIEDMRIGNINIMAEIQKMYTKKENKHGIVLRKTFKKIKDFLELFLNRKIEGNFKKGFFEELGYYQFIPVQYKTFFGASKVQFIDKFGMTYELIPGERYKTSTIFEKFIDKGDPVYQIGIGIQRIREFETFKEAAKMFVDNINILSKGDFKSKEDLLQYIKDSKENIGICRRSFLKTCKEYCEGFNGEFPGLIIKEYSEAPFTNLALKIPFIKEFRDEALNYAKQRLIREEFKKDSDPIKDMGIGVNVIVYDIKSDGDGGYNFMINKERLLKIIREEFKYKISNNEISRFLAFDMEDIYNEIPLRYFEKNDLEEINKYIIRKIKSIAPYWLEIHSDEAMTRMHNRR